MAGHTPSTPPDAASDRRRLGEHLRGLRKQRQLTLKALSERSGVALSTLSKIELGQIAVSYEKLAAAARALGADVGELFDPRAAAGHGARPSVVRSTIDDSPHYDGENYSYRMLGTGYGGKRMTPLVGRVVARRTADFSAPVRHPGQEFVMVLRGRVRICFETGEVVDLRRHETAYFDSGVGHVYLSTGTGDAEVLVVMAQPAPG